MPRNMVKVMHIIRGKKNMNKKKPSLDYLLKRIDELRELQNKSDQQLDLLIKLVGLMQQVIENLIINSDIDKVSLSKKETNIEVRGYCV